LILRDNNVDIWEWEAGFEILLAWERSYGPTISSTDKVARIHKIITNKHVVVDNLSPLAQMCENVYKSMFKMQHNQFLIKKINGTKIAQL
jgi:hypothetical protein